MKRWRRGDPVIWRSRPFGAIGYVSPNVVGEDAEIVVLFQPMGSTCKRRGGTRGGPQGRCLIEWDGTHRDVVFQGPSQVKVYEPGAPYVVHRSWDGENFLGWYVNLESGWNRTPLGFDSWDHILDVRISDDLSSWSWKDEDELEWFVSQGKLSAE